MKTRMLVSLGATALVLGSVTSAVLIAGEPVSKEARKAAESSAERAAKALAKGDAEAAIPFAEAAVGFVPQSADYRSTLALAYLRAGRFASARQTYTDVLQLSPSNGKVALNLALAQIATGDWGAARRTLEQHVADIPAADFGLAVALAGDPASGAQVLTQAARQPGAGAKTRQNLALTLALAGNWTGARIVAQADLSPADLDARLQQWAAFAQPHAAADQVAALLGVAPAADAGQPVAIALNAAVPVAAPTVEVAAVSSTPAPVLVPTPTRAIVPIAAPVAPVPAAVVTPAPAPVAVTASRAAPFLTKVVFGPPRAVVQSLPTPLLSTRNAAAAQVGLLTPQAGPVKIALAAKPHAAAIVTAAPQKGEWFVQLGAYRNAAVAQDGWKKVSRRYGQLAGHTPNGTTFAFGGANYYRLSVGSFTRGDADRLCRSVRAGGGACFIRRGAGDQLAQWATAVATRRA